jgi:diguanylate cyclase (GGDEF)-like protein/PAS domain S-box-containing protein
VNDREAWRAAHAGAAVAMPGAAFETMGQALLELSAILENATVGILFTRNRQVARCNALCAEMFGYPVAEFHGLFGVDLYPSPAAYEAVGAEAGPALAAGRSYQGELQMRRRDGSLFWCRVSAKAIDGARPQSGTIWILEDIDEERAVREALARAREELELRVAERTAELASANARLQGEILERVQIERRIWHLAHHDALTGLPNRALLLDRLEQALAQGNRHGHKVAVMFLDLDRFKSINDTLGHAVGDDLLKQVAIRLREAVRASDTVSRLGGDEFVIVVREVLVADDAGRVAEKIIAALSPVMAVDGHELRVTPSIGIAVYPDDGRDAYALMKNADAAMYHAKANGRNAYQFFAAPMNEKASRFFDLEQRLRAAVDLERLQLHYQPLVDLEQYRVCGFEALLRWPDAERGWIPPAEFIPVAEETGLILPIGEWVLRQAMVQGCEWRRQGRPALPIAVNLSARQFHQPGLVDLVSEVLADTGQPASLLELEITESTLMHDAADTLAKLRALSEMGVRLAIDDFGTGYSSLAYLKRFPVHKLKVDRSFVQDLEHDRDDAAIVAAVIQLARNLGLDALAEGVETGAQLARLIGLGCRSFQGFHLAHPLPPERADELFHPSLPMFETVA